MAHLILLGDSILDNGAYTDGGPTVIEQMRACLPDGWRASLLAVDGARTEHVEAQLSRAPSDATHLVLSCGGNDALLHVGLLDMPVRASAEVFDELARIIDGFERGYARVLEACLAYSLPLVVCTIYYGCFPDLEFQRRASVVVNLFDDAIHRLARERDLPVVDLRTVCVTPDDYANPIEPSSIGGAKIVRAIARASMS